MDIMRLDTTLFTLFTLFRRNHGSGITRVKGRLTRGRVRTRRGAAYELRWLRVRKRGSRPLERERVDGSRRRPGAPQLLGSCELAWLCDYSTDVCPKLRPRWSCARTRRSKEIGGTVPLPSSQKGLQTQKRLHVQDKRQV